MSPNPNLLLEKWKYLYMVNIPFNLIKALKRGALSLKFFSNDIFSIIKVKCWTPILVTQNCKQKLVNC